MTIFLFVVVVLAIFALMVGLPIYVLVLRTRISRGGAELARRALQDLEERRTTAPSTRR